MSNKSNKTETIMQMKFQKSRRKKVLQRRTITHEARVSRYLRFKVDENKAK